MCRVEAPGGGSFHHTRKRALTCRSPRSSSSLTSKRASEQNKTKKVTKKWQRKHNPRNISRVPRAHTEIFFGPSPNEAVYDVWATGAPRNKHDARTALASSRIGLGTLAESPTRASPVKVSTGAPARKHAAVSPRVWPHTRRSMDRACSSDKAEEKKKIFYSRDV